jgi:hypothetical protein
MRVTKTRVVSWSLLIVVVATGAMGLIRGVSQVHDVAAQAN